MCSPSGMVLMVGKWKGSYTSTGKAKKYASCVFVTETSSLLPSLLSMPVAKTLSTLLDISSLAHRRRLSSERYTPSRWNYATYNIVFIMM